MGASNYAPLWSVVSTRAGPSAFETMRFGREATGPAILRPTQTHDSGAKRRIMFIGLMTLRCRDFTLPKSLPSTKW